MIKKTVFVNSIEKHTGQHLNNVEIKIKVNYLSRLFGVGDLVLTKLVDVEIKLSKTVCTRNGGKCSSVSNARHRGLRTGIW